VRCATADSLPNEDLQRKHGALIHRVAQVSRLGFTRRRELANAPRRTDERDRECLGKVAAFGAASDGPGLCWLGWLLVILGPLIGLVVMASPIPGIRSALLPAIGVFAADAFCVVFGELCVAVFDIADRSPGAKG